MRVSGVGSTKIEVSAHMLPVLEHSHLILTLQTSGVKLFPDYPRRFPLPGSRLGTAWGRIPLAADPSASGVGDVSGPVNYPNLRWQVCRRRRLPVRADGLRGPQALQARFQPPAASRR